jgi:hypothetical protein
MQEVNWVDLHYNVFDALKSTNMSQMHANLKAGRIENASSSLIEYIEQNE